MRTRLARSPVAALCASAAVLVLAGAVPASGEWAFGAFIGACSTEPAWLEIVQPAAGTRVRLSRVHYQSESWDPPIYYGYRVAYFPGSHWFGVEGEFIHAKAVADTARPTGVEGVFQGEAVAGSLPLSLFLERFSITHGVNLVLLNAVFRRTGEVPAGGAAPRWMLVGRLGAGATVPHAESAAGNSSVEQYELGALSLQAAAAGEVRLAGPMYLSIEYKLTRTVQQVSIVQGAATTPLLTQHVVVGFMVHPRWSRGSAVPKVSTAP